MRKISVLLSILAIIAVAVIGYALAKQSGQLSDPPANERPSATPKEEASKGSSATPQPSDEGVSVSEAPGETASVGQPSGNITEEGEPTPETGTKDPEPGISKGEGGVIAVVAEPANIAALVNPFNMLPEQFEPDDLVYPDVRFIFSEKVEKRMLRKEAAEALERLFAGAEGDGLYLAGVSGYRSHATQTALFDRYVKRDGYEKARTYSALPGTSEHETGLAIDVTSSDGKCAAADCFGDTKEAAWLKANAAKYGFIIRYPKGKEQMTGYQYEPWHLRYVGADLAQELFEGELTLEEFYDAVPVAN